jgi:aminomethyltransferase
VGEVTSGNFSPVLGRGIGLAFLDPGVEPGESVEIDVRGTRVAAEVVKPPFVKGK